MTSTKTLSAERRYSNKPFFRFTLKNNWQHFALYLIIMLLVIVLPCVMMLNEYTEERTNLSNAAGDAIVACGILGVLASLVVAVFSGMSAASYVNSKQMVGCYHSFPHRRESIFLIETSVRAIYYLFSYLPCALIAWAIINISLPVTAEFNVVYLKHILAAILCYLLLYSIILFAGGLTGTAPVRLIMTLLILYLPIALYALVVVCAYIGIPRLSTDYYFNENIVRVICSTYRVAEAVAKIDSSTNPALANNIFWCIPEIIGYYGGALLLHKYRKSESSGTTIIWKPVFLFTKYITIFTAALLGIAIFGSGAFTGMERNSMWTIFGLVFGLVLSFMVVNAILYRSSKAIFKGIRGFAVVTTAAAIFMVVLPLDAFNMSEKIYSADNTKSIEVNGVLYENEEDIETMVALLKEEMIAMFQDDGTRRSNAENYVHFWNSDADVRQKLTDDFQYDIFASLEEAETDEEYEYAKQTYDFTYDYTEYVTITQKPKFGIPLSRRIYIDINGEFWDTVARSEEFKVSEERITKVDVDDIYSLELQLADLSEYVDLYSDTLMADDVVIRETAAAHDYNVMYDTKEIRAILEEILPYCLYDADKRDTGVIVGNLSIDIGSSTESAEIIRYTSFTYPIYADNLEVLNGICRMFNEIYSNTVNYTPFPEFASAEDYIDYYAETYLKAIAIVDSETGEIRSMPVGLFKEAADSFTALRDRSYYNFSKYMQVYDSRYWIIASFNGTDMYNEEYSSTRVLYLRDGSITDAELSEYFALSD